jgi:myosin-5
VSHAQVKLDADGMIRRGTIKEFLLEKPRVVSQAMQERNYHIFYQLLSDDKMATGLRKAWGLDSNFATFSYLNQSGCTSVAGINDTADFVALLKALSLFGIEAATQAHLLQLTAAILVLGNIKLKPNPKDKDTCEIDPASQPFLALTAKLFGLREEVLATCFTQKKMKIGNVVQNRTTHQAQDMRDSVAKCLFGYAFEWLVAQMNKNFEAADATGLITVGVLDVFGFEDFENNSLEQLCINYANEKLQQQFNAFVFESELKDYREQGLKVECLNINPPCNQARPAACQSRWWAPPRRARRTGCGLAIGLREANAMDRAC